MVNVIILLKDILYRLGLIVDYVIDEGTLTDEDTIWHYIKRHSGWCEMVGCRTTVLSTSEWAATGSIFYATVAARPLPFTLAKIYKSDVRTYAIDSSGYIFMQGTNPAAGYAHIPSETTTGASSVLRATKPSESISIIVTYEVKGMWKLGG